MSLVCFYQQINVCDGIIKYLNNKRAGMLPQIDMTKQTNSKPSKQLEYFKECFVVVVVKLTIGNRFQR